MGSSNLNRIFRYARDAYASARRARALERLDERTLRDIGLEHEANLARERARLAFRFGDFRFGAY